MDIPGIAAFNNQPTVTNPLNEETSLQGQRPQAQQESEAQSTVTINEQSSQSLSTTQVVEQVNESEQTGFNPNNPGGSIDITV